MNRNGYRIIGAGNLEPASPCSIRFTPVINFYTYNMQEICFYKMQIKSPAAIRNCVPDCSQDKQVLLNLCFLYHIEADKLLRT